MLDDASDDTNDPIVGDADEPYFFPTPGLSAGNRVRAGDTIAGLTGVMQWAFDQWRLRPVAERDYTFSPTNVWPSTAPKVAGRLRLAGFNVLNYFATIDTTASTTRVRAARRARRTATVPTARPSASPSWPRSSPR